jgi:hypothetical protein
LISKHFLALATSNSAQAAFVSWGINYTFSVFFPDSLDLVGAQEWNTEYRVLHPEVVSAAALTILALNADDLTKCVASRLKIALPSIDGERSSFFSQMHSVYYANYMGTLLVLVLRNIAAIDISTTPLSFIALTLINSFTLARIPFISSAHLLCKSRTDEHLAWSSRRLTSCVLALPIGAAMCLTPLQFVLPLIAYPFFCVIALNAIRQTSHMGKANRP